MTNLNDAPAPSPPAGESPPAKGDRSIRFTSMSRAVFPVLICGSLFLVLIIGIVSLLNHWTDFSTFLYIFSASTAVFALLLWAGRAMGTIEFAPGVNTDPLQITLSTVFVTTLVGAWVTTATKQLTQEQGLSAVQKQHLYYDPSDVFFGEENFNSAREESKQPPTKGSIKSNNLIGEGVVYIRYITLEKQVQIENYDGLEPQVKDREGVLRLAFQGADGSTQPEINYFYYPPSDQYELKTQRKGNDDTFELPLTEQKSIGVLKYYSDLKIQGDYFITPLFQIQETHRPKVVEYVIISKKDAETWNPNKYLFDMTASPEGRQISYSTQIFAPVESNSADSADLTKRVYRAMSAADKGKEKIQGENIRKALTEVVDDKGGLNKDMLVFKSTSDPAELEHIMWFKFCTGQRRC